MKKIALLFSLLCVLFVTTACSGNIDREDLIGVWVNGSGSWFSGVINFDHIEFLEDGTIIGRACEEVRDIWQLDGDTLIIAGAINDSTVEIDGNLLTLEWRVLNRTHRKVWQRGDENSVPVCEEINEVDEPEDSSVAEEIPTEVEETEPEHTTEGNGAEAYHQLVGEWNWDFTGTWNYIFNADGTGVQYPDWDFTWSVDENVLTIMLFDGLPIKWEFDITRNGSRLRLSSLDSPGIEWNYIRE